MMEAVHVHRKKRRRVWLALALLLVLLAIAIMPPMVSISGYKSRITQLISESLGRPVHISSAELRLLPRPGFVLNDLTVDEDPAFGAEPFLRANAVVASIRLWPLWRGRVEIGTIGVDEASVNIVRNLEGRWNLDPLFHTAAAKVQPLGERPKRPIPLPYMEATHSRINFKRGAEKLPFSLVDAELSFWQDQPGSWSLRLRGQPARTDLSLDLPDTGVVRLEARVQRAQDLRHMPVHLDAEWREAQLGQLTRLMIGSDPGWRGDLTGELHLDGSADAARIQTRLRATGVHRAEFAPAAPMDFDATCNLLYHYSTRSTENLACDSPLGEGRIRLAGDLPGNGALPHISVELDRIPVAAGLDGLRTVRSDFMPGLDAGGSVSGKISYAPAAAVSGESAPAGKRRGDTRSSKSHSAAPGPLTGSLTVADFQLSGAGLSSPIQVAKLVWEPMASSSSASAGHALGTALPAGLESKVSIAAGAPAPLTVVARFALSGYQVTVRGQASIGRARELARLSGMANVASLDALAGEPATIELTADGPWMPSRLSPFAAASHPAAPPSSAAGGSDATGVLAANPAEPPVGDSLAGTVTLHNANWRADYLANHVEIAQATLHLSQGDLRWDPVVFSYGPVKGTASLDLPSHCDTSQPCAPSFQVHFNELDAAALQAAMLGAREPGTLISTLIARLRPSGGTSAPTWPSLDGAVDVDSLVLGPVTLTGANARLHIADGEVGITGLGARVLGGHFSGSCILHSAAASQVSPSYSLQGAFEKLSPAALGELLGQKWAGHTVDVSGKVELTGFTGKDLAASAKGALRFDWRHGAIANPDHGSEAAAGVRPFTARFDRWTGDADIAGGTIGLKGSQVQEGSRKRGIEGVVKLADPPDVTLSAAPEMQAKR